MQNPNEQGKEHPIMTKTLPEMFDDIWGAMEKASSAAVASRLAAKDSGEAAQKAVDAALAKVEEDWYKTEVALRKEIRELKADLSALRTQCAKEAAAVDKALLFVKQTHVENSPFLNMP